MQVGTFSASSGLDIWLLPNFLPFHVHALLLNPWATKKLLCEQFIQPAIFPPFVTALSLMAAPFLTPELGSDICAWHWGRWGGEGGRSWGVTKVLEGKKVNSQYWEVNLDFAVVHANRRTVAFVRFFMVTQDCRGQQTGKNAPEGKDWEVSDVATLGKAFGEESTA